MRKRDILGAAAEEQWLVTGAAQGRTCSVTRLRLGSSWSRGATLATDLAALLGRYRDALWPPFPCSKCGKDEYVKVTLRPPEAGDWGSLRVRRPGPVKATQTWRWVKLGDEAAT